ncbi:MAG: NUDIX domain-containing protein [Deltaproteobacteria bacterium]|nr:NUDIX domain-containing protein [Deltaproteobacteria bacterium]
MDDGPKMGRLLAWYDANKRNLPWRVKPPNPYHILLSEIMLQQTQVETMLPFYERFLTRFPTLKSLAKASIEEVLMLWSGLGYYSRARNLHASAQKIIFELNGKFPDTKESLLELPGVGEYTASAVASIAFEKAVGLVDGNVIRVLTRLFALKGDPKAKLLKKKLWKLANKLVIQWGGGQGPALPGCEANSKSLRSKKKPGNFNQSMMELGATVCLPSAPKCLGCPLRDECLAFEQKTMEDYPTPQKKKPTQKISVTAALIQKNGFYLLAKRNGKKHLQSMWEFPRFDLEIGLGVQQQKVFPIIHHSIMNQRFYVTPILCCYQKGEPKKNDIYVDYQWIKPGELKNFPTSSLNHKICSIIS